MVGAVGEKRSQRQIWSPASGARRTRASAQKWAQIKENRKSGSVGARQTRPRDRSSPAILARARRQQQPRGRTKERARDTTARRAGTREAAA